MIRPAKYNDFKAIKEIFSMVFDEQYKNKGFDILDEIDKWQKIYPVIKVLATFQNSYKHLLDIYVYEDEEKKIAGLIQMSSRGSDQSRWHIEHLAVVPERRGKGIAKDLLEYVFDKYMNKSVNRFTIDVDIKNQNAVKLFESLGFRKYTTIHYFKIQAKKLIDFKKTELSIPSGFRPYKSSDAKCVFDLYVSCTPSSIRIVEQKELSDFQIGAIQQVSQYIKEYANKSNHLHFVVEKDNIIIASLEIIVQLKKLPHIVRLLVHSGYEDLNEQLLIYSLNLLNDYPSNNIILAASEHQKNKLETFKKLKLHQVSSDYLMVKDNFQIVNLKDMATEGRRVELNNFKPIFVEKDALR